LSRNDLEHVRHEGAAMSKTNGHRERATRWRRFAAALGISGALAAAMVIFTANGLLAASFSISGLPFTVTASELHGTGFEQFAALDAMEPGSPNEGDTGGQVVVIVSAIDQATLTNLCQSIDLGGMALKITAGDENRKVTAHTLVVDSDLITGDAQFTKINIGQDASSLDRVPGVKGNIGVFGQQADEVTITNLRQNNWATTAATFTLPNLRLGFTTAGGC